MIPNPDIWGAPTSWEQSALSDIGIYNSWIEGKFPVFDTSYRTDQSERYEINSGVSAGKLTPGEPFDTSCCPWRIKGDSYFLDYKKLWFTDEGGNTYATHTSPLYTQQVKDMGVPVIVTTKIFSSANNAPKITQLSGIWNPLYGLGTQLNVTGTPLLQFNYQKILLHAKINAATYVDQEPSDSSIFTVEDYFENRTETHPYVRGLMFDVYMWDGTQWRYNDYGSFNIMPVNAEIQGFDCGDTAILAENCTILREGISGKVIGAGGDKFGVIFNGSWADDDESTSYYLQQSSSQESVCFAAMPDDWSMKTFRRWDINYAVPYVEDVSEEWVYSQFASLGFWFYTGTTAGLADVDLTDPDEHTHVPLFDEYGTTTGNYESGAAALTAPASQWTIDVFERDIYHGEPPYDPSHYDPDNETKFNSAGLRNISQNIYLFDMQDHPADDPLTYLYLATWGSTELNFAIKNFATISPIDCVQGLLAFPICIVQNSLARESIYSVSDLGSREHVFYANVESDVSAYKLPSRTAILDMGYIDIYRKFNDFRDFEPYTSLMLYVPFCGYTQIDCSTFMGKKLKLKYIIDFVTGGCTACILSNNLCVQTVNGQIGIQIPLTGTQTSQIRQAYDQAQLQYKQAQTSTVATVAGLAVGAAATVFTGGSAAPLLATAGAGAISTLANAQQASERLDYALNHMTTPFKTVGGTTSAIGFQMELTPRVIVTRPRMLSGYNPSSYAVTNGYACCCSGTLKDFSGYTQCSSVDLSGFNAPEDDKVALMSLLQKGVIL